LHQSSLLSYNTPFTLNPDPSIITHHSAFSIQNSILSFNHHSSLSIQHSLLFPSNSYPLSLIHHSAVVLWCRGAVIQYSELSNNYACSLNNGSFTINVVPFPFIVSYPISPFAFSIMLLTMARPIPIPPDFVVKFG
jgi:hypothetical protein